MKKKYLNIIDPIHDFIQVYDHELPIINHSIFQRLRRIRQLSSAHLIYPGAHHTRFEHSLGVMHIASQAGHTLHDKEIFKLDDIQTLRLASLLHDIGHGPFSHIFEEITLKNKISHEDITKEIILKSEIGDILSSNGFDKKFIAKLSVGESKHQYLNEIVSGVLSADMMDYLKRDGYFTGAEHAKIDHKRIIQSLVVYKKRLALERSALYSFESMMHSRYQMFKTVYFHKSVRATEVMLIEALKSSNDEFDFSSFNLDEFLKLTDEYVLSSILLSKSPRLKRAQQFVKDYHDRKLLKCVFERTFTRHTNLSTTSTDQLRTELSKRSKIDESEIFIDNSITSSLPLAPSKNESKSIVLVDNKNDKLSGNEIEIAKIPLISSMSGFMNILRVFTFEKHKKKVEIAAKSLFGESK